MFFIAAGQWQRRGKLDFKFNAIFPFDKHDRLARLAILTGIGATKDTYMFDSHLAHLG